jgi:multidrug efflux pump subunit AcrA (membrane-fusion protein)
VSYIAADASFDAESNQSYYDVHVALDTAQLAAMPNVKPVPGMPVQVMIATGEQTIMTYLLDPVLGGFETAMVENE